MDLKIIFRVSFVECENLLSLKFEVLDKIAALVAAAFGLVAALAWNETLKAIFKQVFGTSANLAAMITYASLSLSLQYS